MAIATMTSKGQVTIPKKVREQLSLRPGDKLDFRMDPDGAIRIHPIARKVAEAFGAFQCKATKAPGKAEIKRRLRRAFREGKL